MPIDEADFNRLWHEVFGNGKPGMDEAVRLNTVAISSIKADIKEIRGAVARVEKNLDDDKARREGSRNTLNWIRWALGFLGVLITLGGAVGLATVHQNIQSIAQQLNKIPSLPE